MIYGAFPGIFTIVFGMIFVIFVITIVSLAAGGISTWSRNNHSPRLTVSAQVVAKRTDVSYHRHGAAGDHADYHTTSNTWYYVTFQVESGDRREFSVSGTEYGMLVEGDRGNLSFQGTRYLGFVRL